MLVTVKVVFIVDQFVEPSVREIFLKLTIILLWINGCEYVNVIYLNCGQRREYESDLRSNERYLSSSEKKAWKKFRPVQDVYYIINVVVVGIYTI